MCGLSRLVPLARLVAILTFSGYFVITAVGDLFPLEAFGAVVHRRAATTQVTQIADDSPAARAGLLVGDEIVTVDGRRVVNALDWAAVFARIDETRPLAVAVNRGGATMNMPVLFGRRREGAFGSDERIVVVLTRAVQLCTLLFAIALAFRATDTASALGAWLLGTIAIYSVGLPPRMAIYWRQAPFIIQCLLFVPSVSKVLIGPVLLSFFRALLRLPLQRPHILWLTPAATFALWDVAFLVALLYQPAFLPQFTRFLPLVIVGNLAYVASALVLLVRHYWTLTDLTERRRLRWIVTGSVVGCVAGAPAAAGIWLVSDDPTLGYHSPLPLQLTYTAFLVMPASLWWAIARRQLFDIDFVVRRGLQWVFARHALFVVTPLVVAALLSEAALHRQESLDDIVARHAPLYIVVLGALAMFRAQRARLMDWIDRRLLRERYDAARLLREVAQQVRRSRALNDAAMFASAQIDAALHPEWVAIIACHPSGHREQVAGLRLPRAVVADTLLESDEAQFVARAAGGRDAQLCIAMGEKRSGEPYSTEDRNLLQAVAESLAELIRTERARFEPEDEGARPQDWERRLWGLSSAVAEGLPVNWANESSELVSDSQRQVLLELQALERLMQVHADPETTSAPDAFDVSLRWGAFELRAPIGAGRFGTVFRAWDPQLERDVAVKLLNLAGVDRAAYLKEARHLARVRHPNVVHVYGAGESDGLPGFWMELLEGQTLAAFAALRGPLPVSEVVGVGTVLCTALGAVHRAGLVHQDVKAQNVMRDADGRLVLMDLGAVIAEANQPTVGTPAYMAPELFEGAPASARTDIYSLGVLLFHLATATLPVPGTSSDSVVGHHRGGRRVFARDRRPELPVFLADAIDRALSPEASERFITVDAFAEALRQEVRA